MERVNFQDIVRHTLDVIVLSSKLRIT